MKKSESVIRFQEASPKWTIAFQDYFNHVQTMERGAKGLKYSETSLSDKETVLNKLFAEDLLLVAAWLFLIHLTVAAALLPILL